MLAAISASIIDHFDCSSGKKLMIDRFGFTSIAKKLLAIDGAIQFFLVRIEALRLPSLSMSVSNFSISFSSILREAIINYFIKNSIEYIVHEFYYHSDGDDDTIAHDRFMECILVFENNCEKENFKEYLKCNWKNKQIYSDNIWLPYFEEFEGYNMDVIKKECLNSQILQKMLVEFRNE